MKKIVSILLAASCMLAAAALLPGCNRQEEYTLKWYFPGNPTKTDNKEVYAAASNMIKEKLGFGVEFIPFELGSYSEKMKMIISSGEDFDICWTSPNFNDYKLNVANEAFFPLDGLLETTPDLKNLLSDDIWDATRVQGEIYGVPTQQIMARSLAVITPKMFYDRYGDLLTKADNFEELGGYLAACTQEKPNYAHLNISWGDMLLSYHMEEIIGQKLPGAVYVTDDRNNIKVFNQYDTEWFENVMKTRAQWTQNGYTINALPSSQSVKNTEYDIPIVFNTYKPGLASETNYSYDIAIEQVGPAYLTTSGVTATLNAISATSKHPEEAIKLMEYINTDPEINNLLVYGIEDKHYVKVDENTIKTIDEEGFANFNWVLGNTFNLYVKEGVEADCWDKTKELNDNATPSCLLGFSADITPIALEATNCASVVQEYYSTLEAGIGDTDALIAEMREKFKTAGADKIIEELQRQVDEWVKNNR
ncbi:MAG: ABC transporter substrate-binding protein [Clostridia bacterium]|nr:ABC transporter substrate-binding protein [Clostridia bacterium]